MHALHGFIVHVEKHIEDELTHGSLTVKIDSQLNLVRNAVTKGIINALPLHFTHHLIDIGCEIVFDPRITQMLNTKGVFTHSKHLLDEEKKLYHIPFLQDVNFVFAIKGTNGEWINVSDHDILKPIEVPQWHKDEFGLQYKNESYDNYKEGIAEMYLPTTQSEETGFKKGLECYFKKGIEWIIELDGEKFYAIRNRYVYTTKQILDDLPGKD